MLDQANVVAYLRSRRVLGDGSAAQAEPLDGGVSNEVLAVRGEGVDVVVKQALPQLRVADEWLAKPERVLTEGRALRLAATIAPEAVPPVLDIDEDSAAITIGRAPRDWRNWKSELLAGRISTDVATGLGEVLGRWHAATADDPAVAAAFDDVEAFVQLRVDPYHRTSAERAPEAAGAVAAVVERMLATKRCLVHGDYSPKNILVGDSGAWVLDWEVAHTGDPAFDVAFMVNHLVLKAVHAPAAAARYRACATGFIDGYQGSAGVEFAGGEPHVVDHLGCLLLARAVGKSPAEYLTPEERDAVRRLALRVLLDRPATIDDVWRSVL